MPRILSAGRGGGGPAWDPATVEGLTLRLDVDPADCGQTTAAGANRQIATFEDKAQGIVFSAADTFITNPYHYGEGAVDYFGGKPAILFPVGASWCAHVGASCFASGYSGGYTIAAVLWLSDYADAYARGIAGVSRYDAPANGFGLVASLGATGPYHYLEGHHSGGTGSNGGEVEQAPQVLVATRYAGGELVERDGVERNNYGTVDPGYNATDAGTKSVIGAVSSGRSTDHLRGFFGRILIYEGNADAATRAQIGAELAYMYGEIPHTWDATASAAGGSGGQLVRGLRRGGR